MRRSLIALYCVVIVVLTACSGSISYAPSKTADASEHTPDGNLRASSLGHGEEPDVTKSLTYADESLGDDIMNIRDFSVTGSAKPSAPVSVFLEYTHYLGNNEERYQAFVAAFPDLPMTSAIALVNINADYGYYNNITEIERPEERLVLCNKNFQLPTEYEPEDLRKIEGFSVKMTDEAASAFEAMRAALREELGLPLIAVSGYRSYNYQKTLYSRYAARDGVSVADTYSARAGHSEHQTGLAVDILHRYASGSLRSAGFQNTAQYAWMLSHAHEYGFILRYREGYESITGYRFEPWHWRYIGPEDATRMFEGGYNTFEEYMGTYLF